MTSIAAPVELETDVAERFRLALRNVAAAVAIVTAFDDDGVPHGTTVSAFTPLSMDPALLLVSLDNASRLLRLVKPGRLLGVNVLAAGQADIGLRFAQRVADRWRGLAWQTESGAPALRERHAFIGVATEQLIPAGDHTLVVGAVREAGWTPGEPLLYWQRAFGTYQQFESVLA
jgi:flavin reductase (DIM6/NTAB) family NADH-FMN oxidoreductase RutF